MAKNHEESGASFKFKPPKVDLGDTTGVWECTRNIHKHTQKSLAQSIYRTKMQHVPFVVVKVIIVIQSIVSFCG